MHSSFGIAIMKVDLTFLMCLMALYGPTLQDKVTQWPVSISAREGEDRIVNCTYELTISSGTQYLQWYRQDTNSAPKYIIQTYKTGSETKQNKANENEDRLSTSLNTSVKFTSLKITNLRLNDSAVYYCALKGWGNKLIFGNGTRLIVEPKEKSKTAAFVLGSDKDNKEEKARACLITDFSSHNISVHFGGVDVPVVPSVIKGDKQYSVVAFLPESKDRSNFNCNAFVNGNTTEGDNNDIENVCESDVAYVFESDEKLNSLSLMVLGLRVIFLKSIVFNVLMTVRAWMS